MTTEEAIGIANVTQGSMTVLNNILKDQLCTDYLPQEVINSDVMKNTHISSLLECNETTVINDKGSHITAIQEFYRDTNIFITGGTGFMGKLLIEKLIYSCPHINMIYILVRNRKGKSGESRVQELFQDPLFDRLRNKYPSFKEKIQVISGDCSQPGLGLSAEDRAGIIEHVHIVFNLAATIRFDEKLEIATSINIRATRDLMVLCRNCHHIKAVMHVSTAYSHCYHTEIKEEFYDVPVTSDRAIKMAEALDEKILTNITPLLLGKWPNTYTYTKAISEDTVRTLGKSLPVGIFRPSIIICTRKEPLIGWNDSFKGPVGAMSGVLLGIIRVMKMNSKAVADFVPGDMTTSALIASAWDVENRKRCGEKDIPIYNYISSQENPITWGKCVENIKKYSWEMPSNEAVWMLFAIMTTVHIIFKFYAFFLHTLPAVFIDVVLYSIGQKPKLLKMYGKIHKYMEMTSYFSARQWKFSNSNTQQLWLKMSPEDCSIFDFNISGLNWDEFFRESLMGIRTYLLKEDPKTLPDALKRRYRLYWLHQFVELVFLCLLLGLFWVVTRSLIPVMP